MSISAFDRGFKAASLGMDQSGCLMTGADFDLWMQGYRAYKKQTPVRLEDCFDSDKVGDEFANKHFKNE